MAYESTELVIITGMSGAGRTEAMHTFEDLGYFCIDNLPPTLLTSLVQSHDIPGDAYNKKLAVVCDARTRDYFDDLGERISELKSAGLTPRIIFLDADDDTLLARYKASRRRHPMCTEGNMTILDGIKKERAVLSDLRKRADFVLSTTRKKPAVLRSEIKELFGGDTAGESLAIVVYSFGFKHAGAADADIVIDVRFLPNPYYDPDMRHLTGLDDKVSNFVIQHPETKEFLKRWYDLLDCVMPGYVAEGKQQLVIGVGCTGGQHRSVAIAEATGAYLDKQGYRVAVSHRDLSKADTKHSKGGE